MNATSRPNFETRTCSRCHGKGFGDWVREHGVCFKCQGKGVVLTKAGREAYATWIAANSETITIEDLRAGDRLLSGDGSATFPWHVSTVVAVEETSYSDEIKRRHAATYPTHKLTIRSRHGVSEDFIRPTTFTRWTEGR